MVSLCLGVLGDLWWFFLLWSKPPPHISCRCSDRFHLGPSCMAPQCRTSWCYWSLGCWSSVSSWYLFCSKPIKGICIFLGHYKGGLSSFVSNCLVAHTVLALCLRVLMTLFCRQVVVTVPVQIHVSMGWFSVDSCHNWSICLWYNQTVHERNWPIWFGFLRCKLDPGVNAVDVMENLILACWTQEDTSVIYIPLPYFGRVLGSLNGLNFKVLHEEVSHYGADGWPHGCSIYLLIKAALELKIGCFQAKLQ